MYIIATLRGFYLEVSKYSAIKTYKCFKPFRPTLPQQALGSTPRQPGRRLGGRLEVPLCRDSKHHA